MWDGSFGETLKRIRNECGLLQADLAERMGVSQQAISQWEREKEWPKLQTIERLAAALHVSPEYLVGWRSKEEAMKHWTADFTIKYTSGRKKEGTVKVESHDITRALATVINDIINPMRMDPEVEEVVVWNIGIIEDDVF